MSPMSPLSMDASQLPFDPAALIGLLVVLVLILVVYYAFMIRAVLQMLRAKANTALIVFGLIACVPFPLILFLGLAILIIWSRHKHDLAPG